MKKGLIFSLFLVLLSGILIGCSSDKSFSEMADATFPEFSKEEKQVQSIITEAEIDLDNIEAVERLMSVPRMSDTGENSLDELYKFYVEASAYSLINIGKYIHEVAEEIKDEVDSEFIEATKLKVEKSFIGIADSMIFDMNRDLGSLGSGEVFSFESSEAYIIKNRDDMMNLLYEYLDSLK